MATTVRVHVEGLSDLLANMRELGDKTRKKFIRSAALAGANVIKTAAVARAPKKTGDLKAAISTRRSRKYSSEAQSYEQRDVGVFKVRGGKYKNTSRNRKLGRVGKTFEVEPPSFYWRMLEFGTVYIPPGKFSFLRPGFDASKESAKNATISKLKTDIDGFKK